VDGRCAASCSDRLALSPDRTFVTVGDRRLPLSQFLAYCARTAIAELEAEGEDYSEELCRARDLFVQTGLEALAAEARTGAWLQIGIRPSEDLALRRELCQRIAGVARRLLSESAVDNFFFMHKSPGMRLRFERGQGSPYGLEEALYEEVAHWNAEGLVEGVEPGLYEPESQLFGGQTSMKYVHALFTVDSLIWLDYHSCRTVDDETISPAWLVSLAALRPVFAGLDITGWEDIGVWDRIREMAGRRLGEVQVSLPMYAKVADELRDTWSHKNRILDGLHPAVAAIVAHHDSALLTGAARWRSGYFCNRRASLGPRAAAAFYVIFHWNRAALSHTEQALLTESLAERIFDDACG
jgi:thiopeptide-type bacteriocin biosynthesis protein